jgi:phosphatidylglycerophosphate synthase
MSGAQEAERGQAGGAVAGRGRWATLSDWARAQGEVILRPIIRLLARLGVHPNTVTLFGFLLQVGVGVVYGLGWLQLGGLLLLVIAPVDALDGSLARALGRKTRFGAFLDSTLDRLSDSALILGLTAHFIREGNHVVVALLLTSLVAAMLVSYIRARAESLGYECKVGLMSRLERIVLIGALTLFGLPVVMAWALAVLSVFTVVQRMVRIYLISRHEDGGR